MVIFTPKRWHKMLLLCDSMEFENLQTKGNANMKYEYKIKNVIEMIQALSQSCFMVILLLLKDELFQIGLILFQLVIIDALQFSNRNSF